MGKREQGRWCSSCGVRLSWDDDICPHCGLPQERARTTVPVSQVPEIRKTNDKAEFLARIVPDVAVEPKVAGAGAQGEAAPAPVLVESALPTVGDSGGEAEAPEEMAPRHSLVVSLLLTLAVMGGLVVLIMHPWNPRSTFVGGAEEADPSAVGFPSGADASSGQGEEGAPGESSEADDATFAQLSDAYSKLIRYEERADDNASILSQIRSSGSISELTSGRRTCEALAIDVGNLLARLSEVDVSTGTYAEDLEHLQKLGTWLQNRVDALTAEWNAAAGVGGAAPQDATGTQGQETYKVLFERRCGQWEPKRK